MSKTHTLDPDRYHHEWDNRLEPALTIASGDTVELDLKMGGYGQISPETPFEAASIDFATLYFLAGPIAVDGAKPGDTLEVEILSLETSDWGCTFVLPDFGLLPEDFPDPFIRYFDLGSESAELTPAIQIPLDPFLGTMGTHPDEPATASPFPPHKGGGNIDTRHLVAGSKLLLPVWVDGAMFSCGDGHAAQGDGEVCVTAIECGMKATLRFRLLKSSIPTPRFVLSGALTGRVDSSRGFYGTMGIEADLMQGAKSAVRSMIDLLGSEHGVSPQDAYVLCSLAGDLKVFELVDAGVWNVGMTMPRSVLRESPWA